MSTVGPLSGRRVVVTGSSKGIGLAIATRLAELGASLALVARDPIALGRARASLVGGPHDVVVLDVTDEAAWQSATESLEGSGRIDGLVTAAGILGPIGPVGTWRTDEFRRTLDVNVTGTLLAIMSCLPALSRHGGAVVALSGGGGSGPLPRFDAYAASKVAVVRLVENLSSDLAATGVRLNAIAPGFVVTDMHQATIDAGPGRVGQAYFERTKTALERGSGDPPELAAELAGFLLSEGSTGITGRLISARWDPWREEAFQQRLRDDPDFCTLRRIDAQFFESVANDPPS